MDKRSDTGKNNYISEIFCFFSAHPYISAFIICLLMHFFTFAQEELVPANTLLIGSAALAAPGLFAIWKKYKKENITVIPALLLSASVIAGVFVFSGYFASGRRGIWIILVLLAAMVSTGIYCKKNISSDDVSRRLFGFLIIGTGFLVKLMYIFYTNIYTRQNDVGEFTGTSGGEGHMGYIEYLLYKVRLPDFDVRTHWQFYHPPLHHSISAVWIYINQNIFGLDFDSSRESLQILSLFYSMAIIISAYKILRHFKLSGISLYAPLSVISLHPAFTFFSGALNNDALSVAFMTAACYTALKWYESQNMKDIIKLALCIGLGMMSKLSAVLIAFPVAFLFLNVFISHFRKKWKKLAVQYLCFGAVCFPLALWYQVRNYIRFGVPLTFVQELGKDTDQYIGNMDFMKRITDFSSYQFRSIFQQWAYRDEAGILQGYNEYNPLICILKNSIFNEGTNETSFRIAEHINVIMSIFFIVNIIIAAAAILLMIAVCFRKTTADAAMKAFFIFFHVIMAANFYKMAADYPFTCTMNFRYITPTVITGALFCGLFLQTMQKSSKNARKTANCISVILSALFSVCAIWETTALCFPKM